MVNTNNISLNINDKKNVLLKDLSDFIEIESYANNTVAINKIVNILVDRLNKLGAKVKLVNIDKSKPFILTEIGSGPTTLLIYDHYDVMPANPISDWKYKPFRLTQKGKLLYGRGLADNKGHLVLRLQAIETLLKNNRTLPIKIKWIIEGEEEIGSPHIHKLSDKYQSFLKDADLCLWESGDIDDIGRPQMFLGMKGIAYFFLTCQLGKKDLHSGYASMADSATWKLLYALNTLRDNKGNVLINEITNKIRKPNKHIKSLVTNQKWSKKDLLKSLGRNNFLANNGNKNNVLLRHYFGTTCNICGIWSGSINEKEIKTVLPSKAYAKIDFRLVENIDSNEVKKYLVDHLRKNGFNDIDVQEIINEPVALTNYRDHFFKKAVKIIENSYSKKVVITPYAKGSGPMYYIASRFNVPCIQLGAQTISSNIHGPDENISIDNYFKALEATINLIVYL